MVIAFSIIPLVHSEDVVAGWSLEDWAYRQPFYVMCNSTETDIQANFTLNLADMNSDASDLRFTNLTGSELPYWIQSVTGSTVTVWVKFPTTNTTYYVYWGNPDAESESSQDNTFIDIIDNVKLALPMNEGTGATLEDYSGNNYDATSTADWSTTAGKFSPNCLDFIPTNDDKASGNTGYTAAQSHSIFMWVNPDAIETANTIFWYDYDYFYQHGTDGYFYHQYWNGTTNQATITTGIEISNGVWQNIGFSFNAASSEVILYHNGVNAGSATKTGVPGGEAGTYYIGNNVALSADWDGKMCLLIAFSDIVTPTEFGNMNSAYADPTIQTGNILVRKWTNQPPTIQVTEEYETNFLVTTGMIDIPEVLFVLFFIGLMVFFLIKGSPLVGFVVGVIGFGASVITLLDTGLALYPYGGILLMITATLCMIRNSMAWRGD